MTTHIDDRHCPECAGSWPDTPWRRPRAATDADPAGKPPAAGRRHRRHQPPVPTPTAPKEPFPPDAKVAFVDLQVVVQQSKLGQAGHDQMTQLNDKLSSTLATKNKEIQALQDKIKAQQNLVQDAILQGWGRDLDKMTRDAQYLQQDGQVQINQLNEQLLQNFQLKVMPSSRRSARRRASGSSLRWVTTRTSRRRTPASICRSKSSSAWTRRSSRHLQVRGQKSEVKVRNESDVASFSV
jgi:Skp family chaperone for outer membrane proteins